MNLFKSSALQLIVTSPKVSKIVHCFPVVAVAVEAIVVAAEVVAFVLPIVLVMVFFY